MVDNGSNSRPVVVDEVQQAALRSRGAEVSDLASLQAAGRAVRAEVRGLDLPGTVRALVALAEGNHGLARFVQADLEAARLLEAAGAPVPDEPLVAFPPEPGSVRAEVDDDGRWRLSGTQRRSVHPGAVTRALVVARTPDGDRLFACAVDDPAVARDPAPVRTIAPEDPNGPVTFHRVVATPVGTVDWWAARAVPYESLLHDAACWVGACRWLRRSIASVLAARTDPAVLLRLGRVDVWVDSAWGAVLTAAPVLAAGPGPEAELAVRRAVAVAVSTADTVIRSVALLSDARVRHEDTALPSRVAQLQIALRRFDTEANLRAVGRLAVTALAGEPVR